MRLGGDAEGGKKLTSVTSSVKPKDFEFRSVTRSVFVTLRSVTPEKESRGECRESNEPKEPRTESWPDRIMHERECR